MNVTDLVGLVALLIKTIDTLRYVTAKQINGVLTQMLAWGAGVGGVFAVAQTQWASHIAVGNGGTLAHQGAFSLVAIGLSVASGGSVLKDFQAALDNTNTAAVPPLLRSALTRASGVVGQASATAPVLSPGALGAIRTVISDEVAKVVPYVERAVHGVGNAGAKVAAGPTLEVGTEVGAAGNFIVPPAADAVPTEVHSGFAPPAGFPTPPPAS